MKLSQLKLALLFLTLISLVFILSGCWPIISHKQSSTIYVANYSDDTVSVINGQTNAVVATLTVGINPRGIGVLY